MIRACEESDFEALLALINAAAEAYRGIIPPDRWKDPYMPAEELAEEIAAGVQFQVFEEAAVLKGVMGVQDVKDVTLIRHAYVDPAAQRQGVGAALLASCRAAAERPLLIGTWAAADWAIQPSGRQIRRTHPRSFALFSAPSTSSDTDSGSTTASSTRVDRSGTKGRSPCS